jgi:hypothetical protein
MNDDGWKKGLRKVDGALHAFSPLPLAMDGCGEDAWT